MWNKVYLTLLEDEVAKALRYSGSVSGLHELITEALSRRKPGSVCRENDVSFLPLAVCRSICGEYNMALPAAAAFYILLAAADVFDDLADADSPVSLAAKYGGGLALNAGAALIFLAEKALSGLRRFSAADGKVAAIMETLNDYYLRACAGQHLDIALQSAANKSSNERSILSEAEYLQIAEMKSAAQFESACRIGAMLATDNEQVIEKFAAFGREIGMAAQIADDIQGVTEGQDIMHARITLPVIYGLANMEAPAKGIVAEAFNAGHISQPEMINIRELLFQCGAVHYAVLRLELCRQRAREILADLASAGIDAEALAYYVEPPASEVKQ